MSLRADAIAAYQSSQSGRESDARAVLTSTLTPENVSALTVADVEVTDAYARYVFTDGDLDLAVVLRSGGNTVHLVKGSPGSWTDLSAVTSLAQLGQIIPGLAPAPPPASGPAAWAPRTAYMVGDQVTYGGKTYQCLQAHTSQVGWEPPNVPALWKAV